MQKSNIPFLGFGLGLRGVHIPHILAHKPAVDWFEIISENYMDTDGRGRRNLDQVLERYPVIMHGVSLSIGTVDPINSEYLSKLKALADHVKPAWISDHLCWTGVAHQNTHDLLPVPYTEESLKHIVERIRAVQDILGRPLVLENPSTYLEFKTSSMPEEEFISRMVLDSGCGLLLDVNNIYVTCYNHRKDPKAYIDSLPLDRVYQVHLAGHSNKETHIVDTHDGPVIDEVWALYKYVINKAGVKNTMIEWDDKIPAFDVVDAELEKARQAVKDAANFGVLPQLKSEMPAYIANQPTALKDAQLRMHRAILDGSSFDSAPQEWIKPKPNFPVEAQLDVYVQGYRHRLFDVVSQDYPALRAYLGHPATNELISAYVDQVPSAFFDAARYPAGLPAFARTRNNIDVFACELALLENAVSQLTHAPETLVLKQEHIAALTPDALMQSVLTPRKALDILSFSYPVNQAYSQFLQDETVSLPALGKSYVLVYRHEDSMWRLDLEENEYMLLRFIFSGLTVAQSLQNLQTEQGIADDEMEKSIGIWFSRWMRNGIFALDNNIKNQQRNAA